MTRTNRLWSSRVQDSGASYTCLLREQYAARLLCATLVGRLPNAMAPVSLLLVAQADHGSIGFGGALSAVYLVAFAVGQPVLGRVADRRGPTLPVVVGAIVASCALGVLACAGTGSRWLSLLLVAVAGLSNPPLESGLRTLWPRILPTRPGLLRVAYALDNGSQEAVYVAGPLLAALLALLSPGAALAATASVGLVGGLLLGLSRPARELRPVAAIERHWLGPLRSPDVLVLLGALVCAGGAVGAVRVCAAAQGESLGIGWFAGALPAVMSIGGLVGGLGYGAQCWPGGQLTHLMLLAFGHAAAWVPMLWGLGAAPSVALVVLPGMCFSALVCAACLVINTVAPSGTGTEAFGWLIAAINLGIAAGSAAAGWTGGHFGVALVASSAAALVLLLGCGRMRARSGDQAVEPLSVSGRRSEAVAPA
ncbi:transporter [Streptomyces sp. BE147]|uniref:MFS transporter n=1 Tax=Streptomyces sp. BE147 TaxID=3002524 RepID=UPI002E7A932E|nr:MFS transporter [Streptomyces sp. BE147]MEE1741210.1 transporter [Streptomyces sp. BE147]